MVPGPRRRRGSAKRRGTSIRGLVGTASRGCGLRDPIPSTELRFAERGAERLERPDEVVEVGDVARAIVDGLDGLGYTETWPILGHHTGARIATVIAAEAPSRVTRLILIGVPVYSSTEARDDRWHVKAIREVRPTQDGEHLLHEWRRLQDLSPGSDPDVIHQEFVDTVVADAYDKAYAMVRRHDLAPVLARVECPVLLVAPSRDPQAANQQNAAAILGKAELLDIDGGTFAVHEEPETVADHAVRFLSAAT